MALTDNTTPNAEKSRATEFFKGVFLRKKKSIWNSDWELKILNLKLTMVCLLIATEVIMFSIYIYTLCNKQ